jgi:hypothetical protein
MNSARQYYIGGIFDFHAPALFPIVYEKTPGIIPLQIWIKQMNDVTPEHRQAP